MIPYFPKFKKLDIDDKEEVENFTSQFQPYSDFNFINLWCWRDGMTLEGSKTLISRTDKALIIKFSGSGYKTPKPFYSFLSSFDSNEIAKDLLNISLKEGLDFELKVVPQISAKHLDVSKFLIEEDRDNFDYIYDLEKLASLKGRQFETKRNLLSRFIKKYKNNKIQVKILNLKDKGVQKEILWLHKIWEENKSVKIKDEKDALQSLFNILSKVNLVTVGVFIDNKLVAFCINELLKLNYAITHFAKADVKISSGLYTYLTQKNAEQLISFDKLFLNYQQDLGISGLRYSKYSFRPAFFLKKYRVRFI